MTIKTLLILRKIKGSRLRIVIDTGIMDLESKLPRLVNAQKYRLQVAVEL